MTAEQADLKQFIATGDYDETNENAVDVCGSGCGCDDRAGRAGKG